MTIISNAKFYDCAMTLNRKDGHITVTPSLWKVRGSDGKIRVHTITLSTDYLDPKYDSEKDINRNSDNYYIQINDDPPKRTKRMGSTLDNILYDSGKDYYILAPKDSKNKTILFYLIQPTNFQSINIKHIFADTKKIDAISKYDLENKRSLFSKIHRPSVSQKDLTDLRPQTIERCKRLDLNAKEAEILFSNLFRECLENQIKEKRRADKEARKQIKTEESLLIYNKSTSSWNKIAKIFACICCCG